MKMKNLSWLLFGLVATATVIYYQTPKSDLADMPKPTMIKEGEEEGNQDKRAQWMEAMHAAAPGTDWRAIELQNSHARHRLRSLAGSQRSGEEEIIPGLLSGEWKERGSRNLAGSVLVTTYDVDTDQIYTVSAGGTLWKGATDGSDWQVVNQDLQFNGQLLQFIDGPNGRRLIAQSGRIPHFSDDEGLTWTASTGIVFDDGWGATRHPIVLNDASNTIYILAKPDYWSNANLYKSTDKGETYTNIVSFNQSDMNHYALCNPHGTNDLYLLSRGPTNTTLYLVNPNTDQLDLVGSSEDFVIGDDRAQLVGTQSDTTLSFLSYNVDNEVFETNDLGSTWTYKGTMTDNPWAVGLYQSPSDPELLITGGLNCHRSENGGADWTLMNEWFEYYGDIDTKLHADMMYFKEFENANGEPFVLISNHGGLSISWDGMNTVSNIGLEGLNVGQFYDVSTDPTDSRYIYAGSQDQGFQRGFTEDSDEIMEFEQVISGDYGHTVFTKNGTKLWTVYPGGWISYYDDPQNGYLTHDWEINSENESVWIPPLMPSPIDDEDVVYLAGGNMNGGPGSYIIRLQVLFGNIQVSQLPFDFKAETDSEVSALASSTLNQDHWYAATSNGRFFSSTDAGENWEQTLNFVPGGHYLYGASIYPSRLDSNTVYFGGSGYSNPAVYKSIDNGATFEAINDGLPSTLVFELTGNADESMLFAATEAGPYVYIVAENEWYDLSGLCAPTQTYWSVEYLEEENIVRYGTYGRGIWDFQISDNPMVNVTEAEATVEFRVYPNPSVGSVNVAWSMLPAENATIRVYDLKGQLVHSKTIQSTNVDNNLISINLEQLPRGNYVVTLESGNEVSTEKLVLF